jgi:hypothetical protein
VTTRLSYSSYHDVYPYFAQGKGTPKKKTDDDDDAEDPEQHPRGHEEEEEDEADSMGSLDYKAASSSLSKSGGGPEESDRSMSLSQVRAARGVQGVRALDQGAEGLGFAPTPDSWKFRSF